MALLAADVTLPNGLTLTNNGNGTATISGTPLASTTANLILLANIYNDKATGVTQNFVLNVVP